jgi:hypothetical protein
MFNLESGKQPLSPMASEQLQHLSSVGGWGLVAAGTIVMLHSLKGGLTTLVPITGPEDEAIRYPGVTMSVEVYRHGLDEAARARRSAEA